MGLPGKNSHELSLGCGRRKICLHDLSISIPEWGGTAENECCFICVQWKLRSSTTFMLSNEMTALLKLRDEESHLNRCG